MKSKEHLTVKGLNKIVGLKEKMNLGISPDLKKAFPDRISVIRPVVKDQTIYDPNWFAGFTSAEGSFIVRILKSSKSKYWFNISLKFKLTQHSRDELLMKSLIEYLNCGIVYKYRDAFDYVVTKFTDIETKIVPFFQKYPIQGVKSLDFQDFCKVVELIKEKRHLTKEGLEQISKIKAGMNQGRELT